MQAFQYDDLTPATQPEVIIEGEMPGCFRHFTEGQRLFFLFALLFCLLLLCVVFLLVLPLTT